MQIEAKHPLRERVERGIYKRKTKDGRVRYEVAFVDHDGRQRWVTTATLAEAKSVRGKYDATARSQRVAPSRHTVSEWADEWLATVKPRLRPGTFALYTSHMEQHVKPKLGRRRLADVTVDDIAHLIAELATVERKVGKGERERVVVGYAAPTIRGILNVLNRMLGSAERRGLIAANPCRKLERGERPQATRREFPSLDKADIARLIGSTPERYRMIVALSVLTGLRQSEALALRWSDIDAREGIVHVDGQLARTGQRVPYLKTDAARREVPITPGLARMLTEHKAQAFARGLAKPDNYVFCTKIGTPLQHRHLSRRALDPALEKAGLAHLRWHDLRHVAASAMIAQGMDDDDIAPVLGHANATVTKTIYSHEFEKRGRVERTRQGMAAAFGEVL